MIFASHVFIDYFSFTSKQLYLLYILTIVSISPRFLHIQNNHEFNKNDK